MRNFLQNSTEAEVDGGITRAPRIGVRSVRRRAKRLLQILVVERPPPSADGLGQTLLQQGTLSSYIGYMIIIYMI